MTDNQAQDWDNYWKGRSATDSGEALVAAGVETDVDLKHFWVNELSNFPKTSRVLDMACGAGSVLKHAHGIGFADLTGIDVSASAIQTLQSNLPDAKGIVGQTDKTGFDDQSFELVVSQYGFEYSHIPATVSEIARLLTPGGAFIAMIHKTPGGIEAEVRANADASQSILKTGFIDVSRALFEASMTSSDDKVFNAALDKFRPAQDALLVLARQQGGLAAHLYSGAQDLYNRRNAYDLADVHGWLDGMEGEISAYSGRMTDMLRAAQSKDDMAAITDMFTAEKFSCDTPEPFKSSSEGDDIGWVLRARKSAS